MDLLTTCLHHWQSFLAFFIGFTTILVCWINHHVAFEFIHKVDTNFLKESTVAMAVYGFNYILISVAANGICSYAYNHHLIVDEERTYFNSYRRIYRYGIYYTVLAFLICFISTWIAIGLYVILFIFFAAPKELALRLEKISMRKRRKTTSKIIIRDEESLNP